jgi:hypothetical protein
MHQRFHLAAWAVTPISAFVPVARSVVAAAGWATALAASAVCAAVCVALLFAPPFVMLLALSAAGVRRSSEAIARSARRARFEWRVLCAATDAHRVGPHAPQAL